MTNTRWPFSPMCFLGLGFLCLFLWPARARADSIVAVSLSDLVFDGGNVCGGTCTETFSAFFNWDATTGSIVPGTMTSPASGTLGGFTFANTGSVADGQGFLWVDGNGDEVSLNTCGFDCGAFPSPGSYNTIDATMICFGSSDACVSDGFAGVHPTSGTFTISAVPEPSSLFLLATGLLALVSFRRRSAARVGPLTCFDSGHFYKCLKT